MNDTTRTKEPMLFQAPDTYLTMAEAGDALSVTGRTVYQWIKEGRIRASKLGRLVRIKRSELDRFMDRHATAE